jgi:hypothetical protein
MMDQMSPIVMFISTGLLVYWISRMGILRHGSEDEINETLEGDLLWGRKFLLWLWFMMPMLAE